MEGRGGTVREGTDGRLGEEEKEKEHGHSESFSSFLAALQLKVNCDAMHAYSGTLGCCE